MTYDLLIPVVLIVMLLAGVLAFNLPRFILWMNGIRVNITIIGTKEK